MSTRKFVILMTIYILVTLLAIYFGLRGLREVFAVFQPSKPLSDNVSHLFKAIGWLIASVVTKATVGYMPHRRVFKR